jgi:carboxyl-terminal processing protease
MEYENDTEIKRDKIMKAVLKISAVVLVIAAVVVAFKPHFTNSTEKDKIILTFVAKVLQTFHYENVEYDDEFSSKVFDEYMKKLDYGKRYFLKSDMDSLELFRYKIDDEIRLISFKFCDYATELIKTRQAEAHKYWDEALEGSFDFSKDEYIETEPDSLDYAPSKAALKDYWRKVAKLAVLEKYSDLVDNQESAKKNNSDYEEKSSDQLKSEAIESVKKSKRFVTFKDKDWISFYLNSIVMTCDPHSEFFMPDDKEQFDISMSGKFEGIGATLQNRDGQTRIVDIIPGSASWRQGELEVNDIILKVGQGADEPIDIANMELDDVVKKIRGKKGSEVRLTVKKIDGTVKIIPIIRDVVIIEETYAKSSILTSKDGKTRVGYIYLPKFYADFNDRNGRFCSKDVEIELKKLVKDGVDGVIVDLRNNGGGSLGDVVDMSGLFIDNGPVVQVKDKAGNIKSLDDKKNGYVYGGPLVIMVNNFSASASEILSAAMQDYDRAIIMGSPSTYGKGTVQSFYDFDRFLNGNDHLKPLGSIKVTIQKFYRINGETTQLRGVIPDIVVPDSYAYLKVGEKESRNALPYDIITKTNYNVWKHKYSNNKVVSKSMERIAANPLFSEIEKNAKRLKKRSDESYYSLNFDKYRADKKLIKDESEQYNKLSKDKTGIAAGFLSDDKAAVGGDTLKTQKFTRWFEDLEKDVYLLEAVNVINDMK